MRPSNARRIPVSGQEVSSPEIERPGRSTWEAFRQGRAWALAAIYDAFADDVERIVRRYIVAPADRDDLIHGTWLRAFEWRQSFDPDRSAKGRQWLARIAFTVCMDFLRRRSAARAQRDVQRACTLIDSVADFAVEVAHADLLEHVRSARARAIETLRKKYPEMARFVGLYYDDGRTHADCAAMLGVNQRRTKYLHKRFLRALASDAAIRTLFDTD